MARRIELEFRYNIFVVRAYYIVIIIQPIGEMATVTLFFDPDLYPNYTLKQIMSFTKRFELRYKAQSLNLRRR